MENDVQAFEQKAREFVSLSLAVCEQELAAGSAAPPRRRQRWPCAVSAGVGKNFSGSLCHSGQRGYGQKLTPFFTTFHRKFLQHNLITKRTFRTCAG